MVGRSHPILKADRERFEKLHRLGCIGAIIRGKREWPITVHHLLSGGKRISHQATIPLTAWLHLGHVLPGYTRAGMAEEFGPSLAYGSKLFHNEFGSDSDLLARVNAMLESID